jgi:membrane protein
MTGRLQGFIGIFPKALRLLRRSEPLILSSSTAFFATFSLSPILIILVTLFGLYFNEDRINNQLFGKIATVVGNEAALEIQNIVNNFMRVEKNWWMTAVGTLLFLFIATTLLGVVKQNIHKIWRIRKGSKKIRYQFRERAVMIALIVITGFLFLFSITVDSVLGVSLDYLQIHIPKTGIIIIRMLNVVFSLVLATSWFTLIFKYLPQAHIRWEVAFNGAFVTGVLFQIGRFLLGKFLVHAKIATIFGASASFALLLLFIFYCSFILYYGAAFTHEYGDFVHKHISAGKHAHEYEEKVIEAREDQRLKA